MRAYCLDCVPDGGPGAGSAARDDMYATVARDLPRGMGAELQRRSAQKASDLGGRRLKERKCEGEMEAEAMPPPGTITADLCTDDAPVPVLAIGDQACPSADPVAAAVTR